MSPLRALRWVPEMPSAPHRGPAIALLSVALPGGAGFLGGQCRAAFEAGRVRALDGLGATGVVSAYALMFGGFLLVGGRAADLCGRRRVFAVGLGASASRRPPGRIATGPVMLVGGACGPGDWCRRAAPAAISLIVNLSTPGAQRTRSLSRLGALGSAGAASGVLLGRLLTELVSWRIVST